MQKYKYELFICVLVAIYIHSCKKDTTIRKYIQTPYELKIPSKFPKPKIPEYNPLTIEGIRLGKKLYFDPILSTNGLSCSSCHHPDKSFSIEIFNTKNGDKISVPPHINLAWNNDFNWNGSEPILDRLCLSDFGPDFFNTNFNTLKKELKEHSEYPKLFEEAFNITITDNFDDEQLKLKIVYAISQFMRTMISAESKLDKYSNNKTPLTSNEMEGLAIFMSEKGDCFHCHNYPLMTSNLFANNGLDSQPIGINKGRYWVTGNPVNIGQFSIPTLRNIELTSPYMHDGRYKTLEEVVEFYNSGVHLESPNIDPIMTKEFKKNGLQLTPIQKNNLVAFLKTLTDSSYIINPEFNK